MNLDDPAARRYLDLLKGCLTRTLFLPDVPPAAEPAAANQAQRSSPFDAVRRTLGPAYSFVLKRAPFKRQLTLALTPLRRYVERNMGTQAAIDGRIWPQQAETMIGIPRLDNIEQCVTDVLRRGVPGDLIETGVWRGGAAIFMRGILAAYDDRTRLVWAADSFEGLPKPDPDKAPADRGDIHWTFSELAVSLEQVRANFARYNLLDEQVRFLVGWFKDSLPSAPITALAVLRLDGDMYESTMDALEALYDRVSDGGYVIVDDYGAVPACRQAIHDFRDRRGITETIVPIDWAGVYWQKSASATRASAS